MTLRSRTVLVAAVVGLASVGYAASARAADVPTHVIAANVNDARQSTRRAARGPRVARVRPGAAGREAARVRERRGRDQPPAGLERDGHRGRSPRLSRDRSSRTPTRRRSRRCRRIGCGTPADRAPRRRTARSTRAWRSSTGDGQVDRRQRRSGQQHREPADKVLAAPRRTRLRGRRLGAVPRHRRPRPVVGDGGRRLVARRRAGRPDRGMQHRWTASRVRTAGRTPSTVGSSRGDDLSRYFALSHQRETLFARTCYAYRVRARPAAHGLPAGRRLTDRQPAAAVRHAPARAQPRARLPPRGPATPYHTSTTRDGWIAARRTAHRRGSWSTPGARSSVTATPTASSTSADNCPLVANVDQTDSDGNKIGDAWVRPSRRARSAAPCPPHSRSRSAPAGDFGAFIPGVTRTYDATTTANVISTAGDARTESDPGRLVNGAFSLPDRCRSKGHQAACDRDRAPTPRCTIASSSSIKATDALRTGALQQDADVHALTTTP